MTVEALNGLDLSSAEEPDPDSDERTLLESWYRYQRHEFLRKLRDLTPDQLVSWSVPPVQLSVLGLVRHMTQVEHGYVGWGLVGGERRDFYGDDDYAGGSAETIESDLAIYFGEVERSNRAVAACSSLDTEGEGHGRPLRLVLIKMLDEYALHAGQAHMLRFAALGEVKR